MRDSSTVLQLTPYPIHLDYESLMNLAKEHSVECEYMSNAGEKIKTLWKIPIDPAGSMSYIRNWLRCSRAGHCVFLEDGKIYPRPGIPLIRYFNKAFKQNIPVSKLDFIDILTVKNASEISDFLASPVPFCRFCNLQKLKVKFLMRGQKNFLQNGWMVISDFVPGQT